ncbi:MAG: tRNA uridine-5-carboxymethylaminomethyl(34) synthesis GTPase MnmE [Gammaproteobacteria bacterium]|nr:tRNA uridine-5-carboxymethylaminomethyl(34) synthesis GTPase MnmE [Gammaproteobacteria bacterium]NND54337.1 tRNA uridine-5-carboxymethylaminomethyl(34) synthesis GTPase MnmE [Gammaproteobacteria bacterium]
MPTDTIVARASAPGRGGVTVVRVSGAAVPQIAAQLLGELPEARYATLTDFRAADGGAIDTGLALYFPAPHSFTGEHVLELHAHGSPVVTELLIERLCELGARVAEAGEFSSRAFLNDKMDLAQAEAIADLIDSSSRTAARAAQRSLKGDFSQLVHHLNDQVTALRVHVEAALDFAEEEIDFLNDDALRSRLESTQQTFASVTATVRQGCLLRDGVTVVLAGQPNAGKSSLLNALAGYDAAIVTDIAGTTRDLVREQIDLQGLTVNVIDTAGLRATGDAVEAEGVRRARRELEQADHALIIIDSTGDAAEQETTLRAELPAQLRCTVVCNKADLSGLTPGLTDDNRINLSAKTGAGVDELRVHLTQQLGYEPAGEGSVTARRRHLESLRRAEAHFMTAAGLLESSAGELMAEELLQVQNALAEITGQFSSDDLLGEIFASFCIGK